MTKEYREDSWRKPAQEMELGDTFITKSRVITRDLVIKVSPSSIS